jgi:hypothetical protein
MTQDLVTCISFKAINSQGFQFNPNYQYMKIKQVQKKKKRKENNDPIAAFKIQTLNSKYDALQSNFKPCTRTNPDSFAFIRFTTFIERIFSSFTFQ